MKRKIKEQEWRRKKYKELSHDYDCGIWKTTNDEGVEYYATYKTREKKWLRKYNNKRIRRFKGEISNGAHYRKINEHWYILY